MATFRILAIVQCHLLVVFDKHLVHEFQYPAELAADRALPLPDHRVPSLDPVEVEEEAHCGLGDCDRVLAPASTGAGEGAPERGGLGAEDGEVLELAQRAGAAREEAAEVLLDRARRELPLGRRRAAATSLARAPRRGRGRVVRFLVLVRGRAVVPAVGVRVRLGNRGRGGEVGVREGGLERRHAAQERVEQELALVGLVRLMLLRRRGLLGVPSLLLMLRWRRLGLVCLLLMLRRRRRRRMGIGVCVGPLLLLVVLVRVGGVEIRLVRGVRRRLLGLGLSLGLRRRRRGVEEQVGGDGVEELVGGGGWLGRHWVVATAAAARRRRGAGADATAGAAGGRGRVVVVVVARHFRAGRGEGIGDGGWGGGRRRGITSARRA